MNAAPPEGDRPRAVPAEDIRARRRDVLDTFAEPRTIGIMLLVIAVGMAGSIVITAREILAPICFGLVVGVVASPLADRLNLLGVPRIVVAAMLLFITSAVLVVGFLLLEPLLSSLATRLPKIRFEIEQWIEQAAGVMQGLENFSEELERAVGQNTEPPAPELPTVMDALLLAPGLGASVLIFAGTVFFFVLTRTELYGAAGRLRETLFKADRAVARYFLAVSIVNTGLGVATAIILSLLGLDNAILWGLAAGILNFVLYLGPVMIMAGLLVAGLVQFSGAMALLPPLAFLCLNLTEAQFVTPAFVGQRMRINPLAVFLAIVIGLWLWGPVGAIVAIPVSLWLATVVRLGKSTPKPEPNAPPASLAPRP